MQNLSIKEIYKHVKFFKNIFFLPFKCSLIQLILMDICNFNFKINITILTCEYHIAQLSCCRKENTPNVTPGNQISNRNYRFEISTGYHQVAIPPNLSLTRAVTSNYPFSSIRRHWRPPLFLPDIAIKCQWHPNKKV